MKHYETMEQKLAMLYSKNFDNARNTSRLRLEVGTTAKRQSPVVQFNYRKMSSHNTIDRGVSFSTLWLINLTEQTTLVMDVTCLLHYLQCWVSRSIGVQMFRCITSGLVIIGVVNNILFVL